MNRAVASKKSVLRSHNANNDCPANKKQKQDKEENGRNSLKKKQQERRNKKVRRVARKGNLLNEWTENESSRGEINKALRSKRTESDDSVIYVGTYQPQKNHLKNCVIDLTSSTESISKKPSVIYSKSLKTIYFPSKNFDRSINLRRALTTSSAVALPVVTKPQSLLKQKSLTDLDNISEKLSGLELPDKYLDSSDHIYTDFNNVHEKTKLTAEDHNIIGWILDNEDDINLIGTADEASSLDTGIDSVEEMYRIYGVNSETFS